MKLTKEQAERNRQAIIQAAGEMFRQKGVDGVCLNELMKAAGFTHGGFYNHFATKEDLISEVLKDSFSQQTQAIKHACELGGEDAAKNFHDIIENYMTAEHRDDPGSGCPIAAFAMDAARKGIGMQAAYAQGIENFLSVYENELSSATTDVNSETEMGMSAAKQKAIRLLITMIGGMMLSRAVAEASPTLSDEILAVGREQLLKIINS